MAIDNENMEEALRFKAVKARAEEMGISDNLPLARYIIELERRIQKIELEIFKPEV